MFVSALSFLLLEESWTTKDQFGGSWVLQGFVVEALCSSDFSRSHKIVDIDVLVFLVSVSSEFVLNRCGIASLSLPIHPLPKNRDMKKQTGGRRPRG